MSRHRRQRLKRFNRTLDRVDPGMRYWENNGRLSRFLGPTEKLAVLRQIRREGCVF